MHSDEARRLSARSQSPAPDPAAVKAALDAAHELIRVAASGGGRGASLPQDLAPPEVFWAALSRLRVEGYSVRREADDSAFVVTW